MPTAGPVVGEVARPREAHDVDRAHRRRQGKRRRQRRAFAVAQLLKVRPPLPAAPQQQPNAQAAQRSVTQPPDERRARDDAADVHPRVDAGELSAGVRPIERSADVGAPLAEGDKDDGSSVATIPQELDEPRRVVCHGGEPRHAHRLGRPAELLRQLQDAATVGAGVRVLLVERPRHDDDARTRSVRFRRVFRFNAPDQRPVPRCGAHRIAQLHRRAVDRRDLLWPHRHGNVLTPSRRSHPAGDA